MEENMIHFKRKMYDTMLKWKKERNGDTALLIQGETVKGAFGGSFHRFFLFHSPLCGVRKGECSFIVHHVQEVIFLLSVHNYQAVLSRMLCH